MIRRTHHLLLAALPILFALTVILLPGALCAQISDTEAIEAGRSSLRSRRNMPWYDSSEEDLSPINVHPHQEVDSHNRASDWENNWKLPSAPDLSFLRWIGRVFYYFLISLFVIVPLGIIGLIVWALLNTDTLPGGVHHTGQPDDEPMLGQIDRVENLPFELRIPRGDLLAEARRLYEEGNYREAIVYLFSYQLLFLDRHQLIRLTKGKTNRQYLREIRRRIPDVKNVVERTMIAFEDVFFGDHSLDQRRFEDCWNALDEFHHHVEEAAA